MTEFSMAKIVRRVAQDHADLADPKALAPFVLDALRGEEEAALARLLPAYVATVLRRSHGADESWASFLEERIPTPDGYVFGRDATTQDLRDGADRRRVFAGRLDRRAAQYDATADAMDFEHAVHAGDLSLRGQSIIGLSLAFTALHGQRARLERHARLQASAQEAERRLTELLAAQTNPVLDVVRRQRDALLTVCGEMRAQVERWQAGIAMGDDYEIAPADLEVYSVPRQVPTASHEAEG